MVLPKRSLILTSRRLVSASGRKQSTRSGREAYRQLLKVRSEVFGEDSFAIEKARNEIRNAFLANREVTDPVKLQALFHEVDELIIFLRENVLQGKMNERGNFDVKVKSSATSTNTEPSCGSDAIRPSNL